jgi:hypothetical protein
MSAENLLRKYRNILLELSDKYVLPDFPHSNETTKQAWITYRQNLRDLPSNSTPSFDSNGILTGVTWPTDPEGYSGIKDPDGSRIS